MHICLSKTDLRAPTVREITVFSILDQTGRAGLYIVEVWSSEEGPLLGDAETVELVCSISLPGKLGSRAHLVDPESCGPVHLPTVTPLLCFLIGHT